MKISEFAKTLEESFSTFFECRVTTDINFGGGEFSIEGFLEKNDNWIIKNPRVSLYDIRVIFTNDYTPKPKVVYVESSFIGEVSEKLNYTLEEFIVYIKEHLSTVKSKTIYENL